MFEKPVLNPQSGLWDITADNRTFSITAWPIRIWTDRYIALMGVAGEFIARIIAAGNFGRVPDEDLIGGLAEALMRNMGKDRKQSLELIEALCSQLVFVDGRPVNFASDFDRKPGILHRVMWAAVVVQFGPLFDEMLAELAEGNRRLASQKAESSNGSGPSSAPAWERGETSTTTGTSPSS